MRVFIAGEGERERFLARLCQDAGHTLPSHGPWDLAVLPLPKSDISEELADQLPKGQKVVCGNTSAAFDQLAKRRGWKLLRVLENEAYALENAALTAEGAVFAAMGKAPRAIKDASCLVIGYGRIGKALSRMLRSLGARVAVAARRPESRLAAGNNSITIPSIPRYLPSFDLVFNTVPAPILHEEDFKNAKPDAHFFELASAPYGFDLEKAKALGVSVSLESGLPGRYCPASAAEALLRYMELEASHA